MKRYLCLYSFQYVALAFFQSTETKPTGFLQLRGWLSCKSEKKLGVWVLLYSKRNIARLGVGGYLSPCSCFYSSSKTSLKQCCSWIPSFIHSAVLSWGTAITAGTVTECYVVTGTSCLPFCLPSSQDYELINGQGYFYPSLYLQYPTHECYATPCSSFLDMQLPSLQRRDNNIHAIICSKLVFGGQMRAKLECLEMYSDNELPMLCITHLCSPHSFLHLLSTLYILDTMLIQMEPFFEAPTDKLTVSPPLTMEGGGPRPWPKPGNLLLMDSASPYWCPCPNPKLTAYCPCKDQQSYF